MEKIVEQGLLYDYYGELLTEHQKKIYEDAVYQDLSLSEIAEEAGISRQGVHDMLTRAAQRLFDMEEKLGMAARFRDMEAGLEKCRNLLKEKRYDEAEGVIDTLIRLDQEENNGL